MFNENFVFRIRYVDAVCQFVKDWFNEEFHAKIKLKTDTEYVNAFFSFR